MQRLLQAVPVTTAPSTDAAAGAGEPPAAPVVPPDVTSILAPLNFATHFARGDLRNQRVMRLREIIVRLEGELPPAAFAELLDDLLHWLRSTRSIPTQRPGEDARDARLRMFLDAMDMLPAQVDALREGVAAVFRRARAVTLFTDVGVPSRQGFVSEVVERLSRSVLPDPPVDDDLGALLTRLFPSEAAVEWFERLTPELGARLFALIAVPAGKELEPLRRDMAEASMLLAMRVSHHGLANDVRARAPRVPLAESPFFTLPQVVRTLATGTTTPGGPAPEAVCRERIGACRRVVKDVERSLEHTGVSVDLVYRLELIRRQLDRLYALLALLAPSSGTPVAAAGMRMTLTVLRGSFRDRSVADLLKNSTRLLARRVVDAAAHSGEHYATRTPKEFHALIDSAAGGGLVTAFTALIKTLLGWAGMAPFWEGFLYSVNYAGSFITMQLVGFTLASKQPSVTAAHLARALGDTQDIENQLSSLAEEVARVVRSQLAATVGNLGAVVPVAMIVDGALQLGFGRGLLDDAYANKLIGSLHPFRTAVVPGAMVTGVALWLSSLSAGALENWYVYRGLPRALASHRRLRAVLGKDRARRVADWLSRNIAGFGGNVALGAQMGLVPTFAVFLGLPVQLPHVAVATGQLAFAGMARGAEGVAQADFVWACVGVLLVGTMNFGVSFTLALWVALRAREVGLSATFKLTRAVLVLLWRRPADFFRAPPEPPEGPTPPDGAALPPNPDPAPPQ